MRPEYAGDLASRRAVRCGLVGSGRAGPGDRRAAARAGARRLPTLPDTVGDGIRVHPLADRAPCPPRIFLGAGRNSPAGRIPSPEAISRGSRRRSRRYHRLRRYPEVPAPTGTGQAGMGHRNGTPEWDNGAGTCYPPHSPQRTRGVAAQHASLSRWRSPVRIRSGPPSTRSTHSPDAPSSARTGRSFTGLAHSPGESLPPSAFPGPFPQPGRRGPSIGPVAVATSVVAVLAVAIILLAGPGSRPTGPPGHRAPWVGAGAGSPSGLSVAPATPPGARRLRLLRGVAGAERLARPDRRRARRRPDRPGRRLPVHRSQRPPGRRRGRPRWDERALTPSELVAGEADAISPASA